MSLRNMIFCPCLSITCSSVYPHPSRCWQLPQMAEEDLIYRCGEAALNNAEHGSETASAAANVTVLSPDECDFWQMNAVTPSAVQRATRPHHLHLTRRGVCFSELHVFWNWCSWASCFHFAFMFWLRTMHAPMNLYSTSDLSSCVIGPRHRQACVTELCVWEDLIISLPFILTMCLCW